MKMPAPEPDARFRAAGAKLHRARCRPQDQPGSGSPGRRLTMAAGVQDDRHRWVSPGPRRGSAPVRRCYWQRRAFGCSQECGGGRRRCTQGPDHGRPYAAQPRHHRRGVDLGGSGHRDELGRRTRPLRSRQQRGHRQAALGVPADRRLSPAARGQPDRAGGGEAQAFLPLIRRGKGRIVNVGSIGGHVVLPCTAPTAPRSSGWRRSATRFELELRQWHVPVSLIDPGATRNRDFRQDARGDRPARRNSGRGGAGGVSRTDCRGA